MNVPVPPGLTDTLLADYVATLPEDSELKAGAASFALWIDQNLKADPITSTRIDRFGLCLVRRSGKSLRLVTLQVPQPGPPATPVMGELSLAAAGNMMPVPGAVSIRGS